MNKIILSTILAMGFLLYGVNSYADMEQTKDTAAQVEPSSDKKEYGDTTGTVTDIEGDTVTVKDEDDKVHKVDVTGFQDLQELQVETLEEGDTVMILSRDGKPYAISKVAESWSVLPDVDMPNLPDLADTDMIKGKVTEVKGDKIKFRSEDGSMHTVKITGTEKMEELQAETIEVGDIIIVSVRDGKPYGINKNLEAWSVTN